MSHKLMPEARAYADINQDSKSGLPPAGPSPVSVRCRRCGRHALVNQAAATDGTCLCGQLWRN